MNLKSDFTPEQRKEALANLTDVLVSVHKRIAELESYFAVSCIDAWPFVVVMDSSYSITALKSLGGNSFNFSAMGRDAMQYSKARAIEVAAMVSTADRPCKPMGKYDFFKAALQSARSTAADIESMLANATGESV